MQQRESNRIVVADSRSRKKERRRRPVSKFIYLWPVNKFIYDTCVITN